MANGSPGVEAQPGMAAGRGHGGRHGGRRQRVRGGSQGKNGMATTRIRQSVAEDGVGPEGGREVAGQVGGGVGAEEVEVQAIMPMQADRGQGPPDGDCERGRLGRTVAWKKPPCQWPLLAAEGQKGVVVVAPALVPSSGTAHAGWLDLVALDAPLLACDASSAHLGRARSLPCPRAIHLEVSRRRADGRVQAVSVQAESKTVSSARNKPTYHVGAGQPALPYTDTAWQRGRGERASEVAAMRPYPRR